MLLCQNPATDWQAWGREAADPLPDLSTASLAAGYVETCRNPARDVKAWLAVSDEAPPLSAVADYVQLCQNPAKDWRAWLADHQPRNTGGQYDDMESTERLCRFELYEMQGWMGSHQRGRRVDHLPTGSTADSVEFDDVQPLRTQGRIDPADSADADTVKVRRFAMLQRFMTAARLALRPVFPFRRRGKGKSKGKATTGGRAGQLRKMQNRSAKRAAFLQRLIPQKHGRAQAPRSTSAKIGAPKFQP